LSNEEIQNLLRTGIETAQSGNKAIARRIFEQVVAQDPQNELGWVWLASVVDSTAERRDCLQKALAINPNNERAKQALDKLDRLRETSRPSTPRREQAPSRTTPPLTPEPLAPARPSAPAGIDRQALLEEEALLPTRAKRRRMSPVWFTLVAFLALSMIGVGLFLLWDNLQSSDSTPSPSPTQAAAVVLPTQAPDFMTPTPIGGALITLPPRETLPPTWTPTVTWTPQPTPSPTITPQPLTEFTLLVSAKRNDANEFALYTMQADGSEERPIRVRLSNDNQTLAEVFDASFAPDGSEIVFTGRLVEERVEDGTPVTVEYEELFVAPARGGAVRRLTDLEAPHTRDADWSPDGTQIIFASDADGDYDLYLIDAEGGTAGLMTRNTDEDRYPAWSPDGTRIAFASDRTGPGSLEIWRMAVSGANLKQLTDNTNSSYAPAWAPDGESIVFLSDRRVNTDLYVMDAEGNGERALLVRDVDAEERDPAWSPDGRWIVFSSNRDVPMFELYLIQPDGSGLERITSEQGDTRYAVWKPQN
jgi:Tol biopolymer transport system component